MCVYMQHQGSEWNFYLINIICFIWWLLFECNFTSCVAVVLMFASGFLLFYCTEYNVVFRVSFSPHCCCLSFIHRISLYKLGGPKWKFIDKMTDVSIIYHHVIYCLATDFESTIFLPVRFAQHKIVVNQFNLTEPHFSFKFIQDSLLASWR